MAVAVLLVLVGVALVAGSPAAALVVFGLVLAGLLATPEIIERDRSRGRGDPDRLAERWLAAGPEPELVAFVAGGPGRVADVRLAGLSLDHLDPPAVRAARRALADGPDARRLWDEATAAGMLRARDARPANRAPVDQAALLTMIMLLTAALFAAVTYHWLAPVVALPVVLVGGCVLVFLPLLLYLGARDDRLARHRRDPRTAAGRLALATLADRTEGNPRLAVALNGLPPHLAGVASSAWPVDRHVSAQRAPEDPEDEAEVDDGTGWTATVLAHLVDGFDGADGADGADTQVL